MKKDLSVVLIISMLLAIMSIIPVTASTVSTDCSNANQNQNTQQSVSQDEYIEQQNQKAESEYSNSKREPGKNDLAATGYGNGTYGYDLLSDNTLEITAYNDNKTINTLSIPSSIEGYTVSSIGKNAFAECTGFSNVVIPNTVTKLAYGAFARCINLKSATIYSSVKSIGDYAFFECSSLKSITIPDSVTALGRSVFMGCSNLASARIGNAVNKLLNFAFSDCTSLSNVTIGRSVNSIEQQAFYQCTNLKSISLPNSIKTIGDAAFSGSGLSNITIPDSVNTIVEAAFLQCYNLKSATIGKGITNINKSTFVDCSSLTNVSLPDTLNSIDEFAFSRCDSLKSIIIPKAVTYIGYHALGTTSDPATHYDINVPGFTIYGTLNSAAQRYANSYGFKFVAYYDTPVLSSVNNSVSGVRISWGKVANAPKYRVFRKTASTSYVKVGDLVGTAYIDKTAKSGTTYTYTVRCMSADGKTYASSYDSKGKTITYIAVPKITNFDNTANGTKIAWQKVSGASKFRVYIKSGSGWKKAAEISGTSYLNKAVKSGRKESYSIVALNSTGSVVSAMDYTGTSITYVAVPKLPTLKNTKSGVQITWKKVAGAAKYRVFRKTGSGGWKKVADTTAVKLVDKSAKNGVTYRYTIRCISANGKKFTSAYNTSGRAIKCKR